MKLKDQLEELRAILFTGKPLSALPVLTHPEYVARFEARTERDPEAEWQALFRYTKAIVPLYRKQLIDNYRMESYMRGETGVTPPEYDDKTILQRLYEDIMELETEEEWQAWVQHWTG